MTWKFTKPWLRCMRTRGVCFITTKPHRRYLLICSFTVISACISITVSGYATFAKDVCMEVSTSLLEDSWYRRWLHEITACRREVQTSWRCLLKGNVRSMGVSAHSKYLLTCWRCLLTEVWSQEISSTEVSAYWNVCLLEMSSYRCPRTGGVRLIEVSTQRWYLLNGGASYKLKASADRRCLVTEAVCLLEVSGYGKYLRTEDVSTCL